MNNLNESTEIDGSGTVTIKLKNGVTLRVIPDVESIRFQFSGVELPLKWGIEGCSEFTTSNTTACRYTPNNRW